jgi:radical SAM superfamily enzyme YgiQ (UPF0313 family)
LKRAEQVEAELEAMRRSGLEIAFIVDDNLIGNKKAIKPILRHVADWQAENGFPFAFFAEASIDLADDSELMELLVAANVQAVFIGVETPNAEALRETKKLQNLRQGGMIVGFDSDDQSICDSQLQFVRQARVVHAMAGMLSAIPKTPLYDRLKAEDRLDEAREAEFGTNVIPKQMSREDLLAGYRRVMQELNDVEDFFDRADSLYHDPNFQFDRAQRNYWRQHRLHGWATQAKIWLRCIVLYIRLMRSVPEPQLREEYRRRLRMLWAKRKQPAALFIYLLKCATHYHYHRITQSLTDTTQPLLNTF